MPDRDITKQIQKMPAFEERLQVKFEGLSAFESLPDDDGESWIRVRGELHSLNGSELNDDIEIELSVIDASGRIIQTAQDFIDSEKFFSFHTFELSALVSPDAAAKLRILPRKS